MAAEELAEARQLATAVGITHAVPIPAVAGADSMATITIVLSPVIAIFLPHEGIRVLFELLANFGVALQILLQCRVVLHELPVIDQRRIFSQLFRDLRMAVHEPVHTCQFSASCVAISTVSVTITIIALVPFVAVFLSHEGVRVLLELFA